jgi:cytochrome c553
MMSRLHSLSKKACRFLSKSIIVAASGIAASVMASEPVKGDIQAGREKNSMCIGCHGIPGYKASFPEVYSVPMIAGQNEQYLIVALRAYANGERTHPTMDAISSSLSEQDMADLAAYYANLK